MPNHFKIHELISDRKELAELEEFSRQPGRTIDEVHEWMQARGYTLSRGAVGNWMASFLQDERFAASNTMARAVMEAANGKDAVELSSAASETMSQLLFEHLIRLQADEKIGTKDVLMVSMGLKNVITSQRHLAKLKTEMEAKQQKAVEEAEKAAKAGESGTSVVQRVKEMLGVA